MREDKSRQRQRRILRAFRIPALFVRGVYIGFTRSGPVNATRPVAAAANAALAVLARDYSVLSRLSSALSSALTVRASDEQKRLIDRGMDALLARAEERAQTAESIGRPDIAESFRALLDARKTWRRRECE